jgi:hypothetical protein
MNRIQCHPAAQYSKGPSKVYCTVLCTDARETIQILKDDFVALEQSQLYL